MNGIEKDGKKMSLKVLRITLTTLYEAIEPYVSGCIVLIKRVYEKNHRSRDRQRTVANQDLRGSGTS